jgi:hypothetical protein
LNRATPNSSILKKGLSMKSTIQRATPMTRNQVAPRSTKAPRNQGHRAPGAVPVPLAVGRWLRHVGSEGESPRCLRLHPLRLSIPMVAGNAPVYEYVVSIFIEIQKTVLQVTHHSQCLINPSFSP